MKVVVQEDGVRSPVFILGCQRSGTSLMRRILDSHSRIACPPESSFFVQLARVYEIRRSLEGLLYMGFAEAEVLEQMGRFYRHFLDTYAAQKGKERWADKTPHYLNHLDTLDLVFAGEPLYVGIVRHGLDVAFSLCEFDWGVLDPYLEEGCGKPLAALRFWKDQNRKLLDFAAAAGDRFCLLTYEDLAGKPKASVEKVLAFIGEPWEEAVLEYWKFPHDRGFEDPRVAAMQAITPSSKRYLQWPPELVQELFSEASAMLAELGYTVSTPPSREAAP